MPVLRPEERRRALRQQGLLVPRRRAQPNLPTRRQPRTQPTRRQSQRTCCPHRAGVADPASCSLPAGVADPTSVGQMETFSKEASAWRYCTLLPRSSAAGALRFFALNAALPRRRCWRSSSTWAIGHRRQPPSARSCWSSEMTCSGSETTCSDSEMTGRGSGTPWSSSGMIRPGWCSEVYGWHACTFLATRRTQTGIRSTQTSELRTAACSHRAAGGAPAAARGQAA